MFYLNAFLWFASMLSAGFAVVMSVWIWRTRPSRLVPAYRRSAPDAAGRYPTPGGSLERLSLDGRRRDLGSW